MIYLVDGHNLIGQMADIDLADPDDEEKLVRKLRQWIRLGRNRKVELYFDSGDHGGFGELIGGGGVKVHFARLGQTADELLIRRLRDVRNAQAFTLVSSDREILAAARRRRVGYVLSEEFAALLVEELRPAGRPAAPVPPEDPGAEDEVTLPPEEVARWLAEFDRVPRPPRPRPPAPPPAEQDNPAGRKPARELSPEELKNGLAGLSAAELADWLAIFGDKGKSDPAETQPDRSESSDPRPRPVRTAAADDEGEGLSAAEIEEWLRIFRDGEES